MEMDYPITLKSLRQQVYDYLKTQLKRGALNADGFLDLGALAKSLGVSRTPLRDALLQLETEGFVSIVPRKGVRVTTLAAEDIREIYQMIGALEGAAIIVAAPQLTLKDYARLRALDAKCSQCIDAKDSAGCYAANFAFHDLFLERCGNQRSLKLVHTLKQQLYDWNRKFETLDPEWERHNLAEHEALVTMLEQGKVAEAAAQMRDVHWDYAEQERFVSRVYFQG